MVGGGLDALRAAVSGTGPPAAVSTPAANTAINTRVDARVFSVSYDNQGNRFRSFKETADLCEEVIWDDWPIAGKILTVLWCMPFMLSRAGSPTLWHATWKQLGRLNENDNIVQFHDVLCRIAETAACYDQ